MSVIQGQERLFSYFNKISVKDLPQFIMLEGDVGSGRHSLCKELADMYMLEYVDVKEYLSYSKTSTKSYTLSALRQFIDELYICVHAKLLVFDCSDITYKEEPLFLKFLEEPPRSIHVFMLTNNVSNVIYTIRNRAVLMNMDKYDIKFLKTFVDSDFYIEGFNYVCRTPGDVMLFQKYKDNMSELSSLVNNIVHNINNATYSNILNISKQFFSDKGVIQETDKFMLFLRMLEYAIFCLFLTGSNNYRLWIVTVEYISNQSSSLYIDKRSLFENYLYEIKGLMYNEC